MGAPHALVLNFAVGAVALRHPLCALLGHFLHLVQARRAHALNLVLPCVVQLCQLLVQLFLLALQHCQEAVAKDLANCLLRAAAAAAAAALHSSRKRLVFVWAGDESPQNGPNHHTCAAGARMQGRGAQVSAARVEERLSRPQAPRLPQEVGMSL
jgi:hypothetical protein